jgi:hypothetical protein
MFMLARVDEGHGHSSASTNYQDNFSEEENSGANATLDADHREKQMKRKSLRLNETRRSFVLGQGNRFP